MTGTSRERHHTRLRAHERFGFTWTKHHRREAVRQITTGRSTPLGNRRSLRLALHIVTVAGQQLVVAYDRTRHEIATVMPVEWFRGTPPPDHPSPGRRNPRRTASNPGVTNCRIVQTSDV